MSVFREWAASSAASLPEIIVKWRLRYTRGSYQGLTNEMLIFFFVVCLWLCLQDRRNVYETTGEGAALGLSLSVKWPEPFSEMLAP